MSRSTLHGRHLVLLAAIFLVAFAAQTQANPVLIKIADSATPVPGGGAAFQFVQPPAIDGQDVVFANRVFFGGTIGVYAYIDGALRVVADRSTPIPNGTGTFSTFRGRPSISDGVVAFIGYDAEENAALCMGSDPDNLVVLADSSTLIPGSTETFTWFGVPWIKDGRIAFAGAGSDSSSYGVYVIEEGVWRTVATAATPIPPDQIETFDGFAQVALGGGVVAFSGWTSGWAPSGFYFERDGVLDYAADTNTDIPGGDGQFTPASAVNSPVSVDDGGRIVFTGKGSDSQSGIYTHIDGNLECVADESSKFPGLGTQATNLADAGIDGGHVAFTVGCCMSPGGMPVAVYTNLAGSLCKIVGPSDTLDGQTVTQSGVGPRCISGNRIALWISLNQGTNWAIYVAEFYPGDLTGDRRVDLADLAELLGHYNQRGARTEGDIDGNGRINLADLEILLMNYGMNWPD